MFSHLNQVCSDRTQLAAGSGRLRCRVWEAGGRGLVARLQGTAAAPRLCPATPAPLALSLVPCPVAAPTPHQSPWIHPNHCSDPHGLMLTTASWTPCVLMIWVQRRAINTFSNFRALAPACLSLTSKAGRKGGDPGLL